MAAANTTSQQIWQVQSGGCVSHCQGTSQTQVASQQNTTIQAGSAGSAGAAAAPVTDPAPPPAAGQTTPPSAPPIRQIQLGCVSECFGTTTVMPPGSGLTPEALQQLLASIPLPQGTASAPVPAGYQNAVNQSSSQVQSGGSGTSSQLQVAQQVNTTVQAPPAPVTGGAPVTATPTTSSDGSKPAAPTHDAVGSGDSGAATTVNQTMQGIWQLQIGCLFYCVGTHQTQQADQSSTTVAATGDGPAESASPVTGAAVAQIWQLQIGCLFWCWDSVSVQSASSRQTTVTVPPLGSSAGSGGDGPATVADGSAGSASGSGSPSPAGGSEPPTLVPTDGAVTGPTPGPSEVTSPGLGPTTVDAGLGVQHPKTIRPGTPRPGMVLRPAAHAGPAIRAGGVVSEGAGLGSHALQLSHAPGFKVSALASPAEPLGSIDAPLRYPELETTPVVTVRMIAPHADPHQTSGTPGLARNPLLLAVGTAALLFLALLAAAAVRSRTGS